MTFWDFFHTHPVHSWFLILLIFTSLVRAIDNLVKAFSSYDKVELDKLESAAKDLKETLSIIENKRRIN